MHLGFLHGARCSALAKWQPQGASFGLDGLTHVSVTPKGSESMSCICSYKQSVFQHISTGGNSPSQQPYDLFNGVYNNRIIKRQIVIIVKRRKIIIASGDQRCLEVEKLIQSQSE